MKRKNRKNNQKSFFFEDYKESEIIDEINSKRIKISLNRVTFLFFVFFSLIFVSSTKIIYLSLSQDKKILIQKNKKDFEILRSDITDRDGTIIARNIIVYRAGIRPQFIKDKDKFLIKLRLIFPEINFKEVKKKLNENKFFYLGKKRFSEEEKDKLWSLGLGNKVLNIEEQQYRLYPQKKLFSHVLGQTSEDNIGISGVEKYYDNKLKNSYSGDFSLVMSLDTNLQYLIREELMKSKEIFKTVGSAALLMNINNGEILSLVSLPDYDLNKRSSITDHTYTNKITKGVYELGSVFKTFTLAAALENKVIETDTVFKNLESKVSCAGKEIKEHDKLPKNLSAEQILIRSSNIGSIRIVQKVGLENYKNFLNDLELFEKINFDLEEVGKPLKFKWGKCKLATSSFGHGITTTPLQLARAYAMIGNGGNKIQPTLIKKNYFEVDNEKKIVSSETSLKINTILRKVVSNKEGTANFANIEGYEVGGKTGTALKSIDGVYSNKKINTFISLFPTSRPKYVLLVLLDEPKPAPNYIYEFPNGYKHKGEHRNTSGWNAVVIAGKIIEKIGPILAINNLQASKKF
tara:strand:- start:208 stop:1935 length:1728 start_codon:yes stop_codon:yes gene_type:complete